MKNAASTATLALGLVVFPMMGWAATDLDGKWSGGTMCPGGKVQLSVEVGGRSGTLNEVLVTLDKSITRSHPIAVKTMDGWQGEWVYFHRSDGQRGSFDSINGLLSADGRSLAMQGVGIGDCRKFSLTRVVNERSAPAGQAAVPAGGPVGSREPSEEEMASALRYALHGDATSLDVDNPINGSSLSIDGFEKLGCVPAREKPGYQCDYAVSTRFDFRSNEGSAAGERHAEAVQALYDWMKNASNAPRATTGSGRFLYVKSKGRWVYLKN